MRAPQHLLRRSGFTANLLVLRALHGLGRMVQVAAIILVLGLLGCTSQSPMSNGGPPPNQPPSPAAAVSFCDNSNPGCTPASAFSVTSLRDLQISVVWTNVPSGTHAQGINIFLPDGSLYQSSETSFAIATDPTGTATLQTALPVAGTWITQRRLTGIWRIEIALDEQTVLSQDVRLDP